MKLFDHYRESTGEAVFPQREKERLEGALKDTSKTISRIQSCPECDNDGDIASAARALADVNLYVDSIFESLDDAVGCCDDWQSVAEEIEGCYVDVLENLGISSVAVEVDHFDELEEIFQWCGENVTGKWTYQNPFYGGTVFFFTNDKEAVMFKLRWGGDAL